MQALDEGRVGAEVDLPAAAEHVALQALRVQPRRLGVVAAAVEGVAGDAVGHVGELEVHRGVVQVQVVQHVAHQQRRVAQADGLGLALLDVGGRRATAVDGQQHEEGLLRGARGLHQGDGRAQPRQPGAQRGLGGLAAARLGGHVQADGGQVRRLRLQVLDDVALAGVGRHLAHGEVRPALGAGAAQEVVQRLGRHPADEAEAARAGEFAGDVAGLGVAVEDLAADVRLARGQHRPAGAAQAVLVQLDARQHGVGQAPGLLRHGGAGLLLVAALHQPGAQRRAEHAQGQDGPGPAVEPEVARCRLHPILPVALVPVVMAAGRRPAGGSCRRGAPGGSRGSPASPGSPAPPARSPGSGIPPLRPPAPGPGPGRA